jgi:uncharacterized protein YbcI
MIRSRQSEEASAWHYWRGAVAIEDSESALTNETISLGPVSAAISTAIVSFYSDHFGRGPTRARTYIEDDLVVCVLRDVSTVEDRELREAGHGDVARTVREIIRQKRAPELAEIVEAELGRRVTCTLGDFDPSGDIVALVFPLEPLADKD